jgi:hypothetical protein
MLATIQLGNAADMFEELIRVVDFKSDSFERSARFSAFHGARMVPTIRAP